MRNITEVVNFLVEKVIPKSEVSVRRALCKLCRVSAYVAIEDQQPLWCALQAILIEELGHPNCAWKLRVAEICADREKVACQRTKTACPEPSMN